MFEDIWYAHQKVDKKKQGQKNSRRMPQQIFLNAKGKKQSQTEANGGENMEN